MREVGIAISGLIILFMLFDSVTKLLAVAQVRKAQEELREKKLQHPGGPMKRYYWIKL
jgi:hypothetical protein